MATSVAVTVADALVDLLNAGEFSQEFTAERTYLPKLEIKTTGLQVMVVPKTIDYSRADRTTIGKDLQIDVGILKKLSSTDTDEIDALMAFAEEVDVFLNTSRIVEGFTWIGAERVLWSPDHLEQYHQFTSVSTLTFRKVV